MRQIQRVWLLLLHTLAAHAYVTTHTHTRKHTHTHTHTQTHTHTTTTTTTTYQRAVLYIIIYRGDCAIPREI